MNKFSPKGLLTGALSFFVPVFIFLITLQILAFLWVKVISPQDPNFVATRNLEVLKKGDPKKYPGLGDLFADPGTVFKNEITGGGKLQSSVIYTLNGFGVRDPESSGEKMKSHLIVSGCSFVFGEGVPDGEILSAQLREQFPDVNVRNIGFRGGGVHTSLRYLELVNPKDFAPEEDGIFIYVLIDRHLSRWRRDFEYLWWVPESFPYYEKENGKMSYQGRIDETFGYKAEHLLKDLTFGAIPENFFSFWRNDYTEEDVSSLFEGLEELRSRYLSQYPKGRFMIAVHPLNGMDRRVYGLVEKQALARKFEIYNAMPALRWLMSKDGTKNADYVIPFDHHPNGKLNKFFAGWIRYILEGPVKGRNGELLLKGGVKLPETTVAEKPPVKNSKRRKGDKVK